jgi:heme exporter protein A
MLEVRDLTCERGGQILLSGVSFSLGAGEALILQGPNGVGKTSLLRTLAGLQPAVSGEVIHAPETVAYASHADGVKAALTVAENLAFWADVYGQDVPRDVFEQFDLADLKSRMAGTLSAGQKRRLGLARIAVMNRAILFLDEPTVSLDGFSTKRFAAYLRDVHLSNGGVAVIATHVDIGIDAPVLDLTAYQTQTASGQSDEAFL